MKTPEIKIGLVGCGTVGTAFLKEIIKKKNEMDEFVHIYPLKYM